MKILDALRRTFFTAFTTFSLLVYTLYLLSSGVDSQGNTMLRFSYINGFMLFSFLLGILCAWKHSSKLHKLLRGVIHFAAALASFLLSLWVCGYFSDGSDLYSRVSIPNRILTCTLLFLVLYFVIAGICALGRKIISLCLGKKSSEYNSLFSNK